MPEETPVVTEPVETAPAAAVAVPVYVQLVSSWQPNERQATAALVTPDTNGRLPVIVRVGGPSLVRWEPLAGAIGLILVAVIFTPSVLFWALLVLGAVLLVVGSLLGRLFIRVPEGAWGLVSRRNRQERTLLPGNYTVPPWLTLTHLVTRRELVFDAPIAAAPSKDGVRVNVDVLVTFRIIDPARFVYEIALGDFDQFAQAAIQDTVRGLVRNMASLDTLDLGPDQATKLKAALGKLTGPFGVEVAAATFTSVTLPAEMSASLEAQRLASMQLAEQASQYALEEKRLTNQAALESLEELGRQGSVEHEATVEELRLRFMEDRLAAHPNAARYDLELQRLKVAKALARNTRAVVGLGGAPALAPFMEAEVLSPANGEEPVKPARRTTPPRKTG
jgi:regulator of protease activity HflC (stomatin/prohibitin superfamily)